MGLISFSFFLFNFGKAGYPLGVQQGKGNHTGPFRRGNNSRLPSASLGLEGRRLGEQMWNCRAGAETSPWPPPSCCCWALQGMLKGLGQSDGFRVQQPAWYRESLLCFPAFLSPLSIPLGRAEEQKGRGLSQRASPSILELNDWHPSA